MSNTDNILSRPLFSTCPCAVSWRCTAFDVVSGNCIFTGQCSTNGSGQVCKRAEMPCPC